MFERGVEEVSSTPRFSFRKIRVIPAVTCIQAGASRGVEISNSPPEWEAGKTVVINLLFQFWSALILLVSWSSGADEKPQDLVVEACKS